jgi:cystathionine beta-synthase
MSKTEGPIKCTWSLTSTEKSPHEEIPLTPKPKIMKNILENIGNTPLVRINSIAEKEGIHCELLVKCEFFNSGGSVKDRIGRRMIEDAEKSGRIKPGDTLIEPTSGNTGIGLALAAAVKGYKMVITLPEKMSQEKVDVLKALGAQIIRTPTEAAWDAPESHIGVAKKLNKEIPNSHILDQYSNPSNPLAHYDGTAEEIYQQCDGKLDLVVISAGTGGTLTGIARKLKEKIPNLKVIGVDPEGSILALPESLNGAVGSYKVEGIGYDFIPTVLERELVDKWYKTVDKESFIMARRMIKEEGLLCGGSSGSALVGALKAIRDFNLGPGKRVVVILPDSVRNYMTKFLNDDWMTINGFTDSNIPSDETVQFKGACVKDLNLPDATSVNENTTCSQVLNIISKDGFDQLPVVDSNGSLVGLVTVGALLSKTAKGKVKPTDPVSAAMYIFNKKRPFVEFTLDTQLASLKKFFEKNHSACITVKENGKLVVKKVVTKVDLLQYLMKH